MRMQSPASSGLLPASYSRRRRNPRANEAVEGSHNGGSASYYRRALDPAHGEGGDHDRLGVSPRRSLSRGNSSPALASYDEHPSPDARENEENDQRRSNARSSAAADDDDGDDGDVLAKPPKLSDFVVNDRCYHRYLREGKRGSYAGLRGREAPRGASGAGFKDPAFLAKLCAGWSGAGLLFLVFVAVVTETQPLFIKGMPIAATDAHGDDGAYRFRTETSNALKAAAAYFLTMVCSLIYLQTLDMNLELNPALGRLCHLRRLIVSTYLRYRRRHYDDIPDGDGAFGGAAGLILPLHHGDQDKYLKSRRRRKRRTRRKHGADGGGGAVEGMLGRIKSWGMAGGASTKGRKKDK